uniref:PEX-1N domain-containing protein n=1 Tax=Rhabditophanes sp. KR3021 TaxID=114890 RepID=A0AC35UHP0_9BILA
MSISVIVSFHERSNSNAFISELPYLNPNSYGEPFGAYLVLGKPHLIVDIYSIQEANKALVKGKQLFLILNAVQATYYAIQNGDQLLLEPVKEIYSSDKIELVPKSVNDFKIISETATLIEDIFLDQIRIVKEGMVLLLWVKSNVYVCLTVKTVQPILDNEAVFKLSNNSFPDMSLEFYEDKLPDLPKKEDLNEIVNYGRVVKCEDMFTWQIEFIEKHFTKYLYLKVQWVQEDLKY